MKVPHASFRGPIQAVVFDLAGTLIDFGSCAPAGAMVSLFRAYHIEASLEEARLPMGLSKRDHLHAMLSMPNIGRQWRQRHGRPWTEKDVDVLYEAFIPLQLEALPAYADLIPGAQETVTSLRNRGLRIGASTGYNRTMLECVLSLAAEQGLTVDRAVCGSDVRLGRPAPWMIFRLMSWLEVFPPAAVVKVGDTVADVEAGLNAGAWSVGVTRTGNLVGLSEMECASLRPGLLEQRCAEAAERLRQAGAHYVIEGVGDLPDVIEQIDERLRTGVTG